MKKFSKFQVTESKKELTEDIAEGYFKDFLELDIGEFNIVVVDGFEYKELIKFNKDYKVLGVNPRSGSELDIVFAKA